MSPIVKVTVGKGPTKETFQAQKGTLCHYSSYFRAALNSDFSEAQSKEVTLDEDEPCVFKTFLEFVYRSRLYDPKKNFAVDPDSIDYEARTNVNLDQLHLARLWIFGDMRGIPTLQNRAMFELHRHSLESWNLDRGVAELAYDNTVPGSKLRALTVEYFARVGPKKPYFASMCSEFEKEFLCDLCDCFSDHREDVPYGGHKSYKKLWKHLNLDRFYVEEDLIQSDSVDERDVQPGKQTQE